jgi:hypothetical protein
MNKIKLLLLAAALVFTVSAQAGHPKGTEAPNFDIQSAQPHMVATAICHYYYDAEQYKKNKAEVLATDGQVARADAMKLLILLTWAECISNMHVEINTFKHSL